MQGSAGSDANDRQREPAQLASRPLPRRVRALLQGVFDYTADEIGRGLLSTLDAYENTLSMQSDQAASSAVQQHYRGARRELQRGRHLLLPVFRRELESALASVRDRSARERSGRPPPKASLSLSLVEDTVLEESIVLNEVANRTEIRNSLPLFLLGQRFGVIAGRPAFDAETLPIGPHRLCDYVRIASRELELSAEHRHLLFKQFDRTVLQNIDMFYEAVNQYLIRERVLPHLTFVPVRARPTAKKQPQAPVADPSASELGLETVAHEKPRLPRQPGETADTAASAPIDREALANLLNQLAATPDVRPATRWPGQPDSSADDAAARQDAEMFELLRELLAGRRALVGKLGGRGGGANASADRVADRGAIQQALAALQTQAATAGKARPGSVAQLKQDLLAQLRAGSAGEAAALSPTDNDAIDLLGLLFDHLQRELRPGNPAAGLLPRLQVPLARTALGDHAFFARRQHPARQMLNTLLEAGEFLNPDDEADRGMLERMRDTVERARNEYDGDPVLFASLLNELNQHMQTLARKAELAERRHVEAARGREKLEVARLKAAETLDQLLSGRRVPRFLRTLLSQAWSDVLALSLLRGGEQSDAFGQQLAIARRLVEAAEAQRHSGQSPLSADEALQMREQIGHALSQVGYHADDVQAITARLLAPEELDDDEAATSTELALRLKQKVRFGEEAEHEAAPSAAELAPAERDQLDAITRLPHGTWFEFPAAGGAVERRRLSWFSTATGHCLFLNHRGQRIGECSLPWLAREVTHGRVRIVMQPPGSLIDRAWGAIVRALQSFGDRSGS